MHRRSEQRKSKSKFIFQQLIGAALPREDPKKLADDSHNHALRQFLGDSLKRSAVWHRESAPLEKSPAGEPAAVGIARMRSEAQGRQIAAAFREGASDKITAQCFSRAAPHFLTQDMMHCYWRRCPAEWIESIDSLKEDCHAQRLTARRGEKSEVSAALMTKTAQEGCAAERALMQKLYLTLLFETLRL